MRSDLKKLIYKGGFVMGWVSTPSNVIAEIIAKAGFEAVIVDLEHSAIDLNQLEILFQVIGGNNAYPLVRLSNNDPILIKRVLDMGAEGIIVPMIRSVEEAKAAIQSAKYPPEGFRSTGIYRAQNYGESFNDYRFSANERIVVILQIEHKDAVEDIDKILSIDGVDAIMIGPYDLSSSYGIAGDLANPIMKKAIERVMNSAKSHNIRVGMHVVDPSIEKLSEALSNGFAFVVYSNDTIILSEHYHKVIDSIKK